MSWIERIKNKISITCADGKVYQPEWINASKQLEWHTSEFDFPELDGTFVNKKRRRGTRYNLELFFQGEFHLDTSAAFEKSLNARGPILIQHPFYGILTVQAPMFLVDNSGLNVSKWTGTVIETIVETNPKINVDPVDSIRVQKIYADELFAKALLLPPNTTDINTMLYNNERNYKLTIPLLTVPAEVNQYNNLFNVANSAVNVATASPLLAMRTTIAMLTAPARFTISVKNRIDLLNRQFLNLRSTVSGLTNPASKQIYQNLAGSIITSMCYASSIPGAGDYRSSPAVIDIIETIIEAFNNYVIDLDLLQTLNGGTPSSYIPNADSLIALNQLLNLAISNLFLISLASRNERFIITEADTNIIILTHRFYGLDNSDNNMNELIANNNIGLYELIQIKKGRKIVYYI
jgi:hypothetical protein